MLRPRLSVVVPVHDEVDCLPILLERLGAVLARLTDPVEILIVDDASTDGSADVVRRFAERDPRVRLVRFARHAGLTAAFDAGFRVARGDVVVTLDADLQNDPEDIPLLLAHLESADAVVGWRRQRRDPWLKRVSSRTGNAARRLLTGSAIRDGASSLRAIRREWLERVWLLHGLHRFLPTLLESVGARVVEVPVRHHPRRHGRSKFGVRNRAWATLVDLLAVRWLLTRRLSYTAVEEGRAFPSGVPPAPMRAAMSTPAMLAAVWLALALVLGAWILHASPGAPSLVPDAHGRVTLAAPAGRILSVWVLWQAGERGGDGWLELDVGGKRTAGEAAFWRRRVHPGWNLLSWSDVPATRAAAPVALELVEGRPVAWAATPPIVTDHYELVHLGCFAGLALALALAALLLAARAVAALASRRPPGPWGWAVVLVTAVALVLRLWTLSGQSLWLDEVLTAIGAQSFTWVLYSPQVFGHPPLQYLVGWLVAAPGASELRLRLPFVLAGTLTVPLLALLGRRLLGRGTGLVAAVVLAVAPFHVELSQTMRPYALLVLLAVVSLLALVEALERGRAEAWLLFSAAMTLAIYTHYAAIGIVALLAPAVLLARTPGSRRSAAVSFCGIVLLTAPWLPVLGRVVTTQGSSGQLPGTVLTSLVVHAWLPQFLGPALGTALTLIAVGLLGLWRRWRLALAAAAWIVAPLLGLWLAQPAHFVAGRHLAFVLPVLVLLLAHGVTVTAGAVAGALRHARLRERGARVVATIVAAGLLLAWGAPIAGPLRSYYLWRQGGDWRSVAAILDGLVGDDDEVVATIGAAYPLRYYWGSGVGVLDSASALESLASRQRAARWIVTAPGGAWPPGLRAWLSAHAALAADIPASWSLPGVHIYRVVSSHHASDRREVSAPHNPVP